MKLNRCVFLLVTWAAWLGLEAPTVAEDWPMLGHDAKRSGAALSDIRPPFTRKWYRLFPEEGIQSGVQPIIAQGRVFLGTLAGVLHAMDAESGQDKWTFKAGGPILHAGAFDAGRVFFGAADGIIYALQAGDGHVVWRYRTGSAIWNAPIIARDLLLVGSRDGLFYALDKGSGQLRWSFAASAPLLNSPAADLKKGCVYVGGEDMRVHALAVADGRELWKSDPLPGASLRGYHPVIAPDGSILVTTQPVIGYDRFQALLLDMAREVFGDFASWRHKKEENDELRAANFRRLENPETYPAQLDYLRRRLTEEPGFQTFFVLDPVTGRQRFVAPIVASESMNGPGAPPVVTPDGRVIVKYQVLLRSRYEHYSPFLNVGYLDTATGFITPIMDQSRTYGWHDSLLLVHDEQCQLSVAGRLLLNTHQDNVNAMDLDTLKGYPQPLALNLHEPAKGEALALNLERLRGHPLTPGSEWLIRGTAVYGGGSVLDVPVAIAGDSFYYLPTHEINSGCALIAYRTSPGAPAPQRTVLASPTLTDAEWRQIQDLPWDWDTLGTPRLKNLLEALPGPVPGTVAAPLTNAAEKAVAIISNQDLDALIWTPVWDPQTALTATNQALLAKLRQAVRERISQAWNPLITPAGKAPEESARVFQDPSETLYSLLLARPFLDEDLKKDTDRFLVRLTEFGLPRSYAQNQGPSRVAYSVPWSHLRVIEEPVRDDLARLYPLWLWTRTSAGSNYLVNNWPQLRGRLNAEPNATAEDCGNARIGGLIAYCRLAKAMGDQAAMDAALSLTRQAMRARLLYELAHPRGGVIRHPQSGRALLARWHRLTPEVARLLRKYAFAEAEKLMAVYVDWHRPGWWLAWNVEQLNRNEVPFQHPATPLDIFTARALILEEPAAKLAEHLDIPWCRADEYYLQKLALTLRADTQP